jgi:hypothetical protein
VYLWFVETVRGGADWSDVLVEIPWPARSDEASRSRFR